MRRKPPTALTATACRSVDQGRRAAPVAHRWRAFIAAAVMVAVVGATATPAFAKAPLPAGFFGVVPQASLDAKDLARIRGVVGTLRVAVYWSQSEPAPGEYDFAQSDAMIGAAAEHGIRTQVLVYGTPSWLAPEQARPPLGTRAAAAWRSFLRVLVRRYGASGEFWRGRAQRMPVKVWQIWNEPNFALSWRPWPSPSGYAQLLRASARTIRSADSRARIALAGLAPVNAGIETWIFLRRLLQQPGVRGSFDLVALHPYSRNVSQLAYQVRKVRAALKGAGLGSRPLLLTELGVASHGDYPSPFVQGAHGQAAFLERAYGLLLQMRQRWRIAGVDWFSLRDTATSNPHCGFCQGSGLFDVNGRAKPAWYAFRRVVRHASGAR